MNDTHEIVAKLWNLCHIMRDDGITYHQYLTELTYVLFLKMAKETKKERPIPPAYRWNRLVSKDGKEQLDFYRQMLVKLSDSNSQALRDIYEDASTNVRQSRNLNRLVTAIDEITWSSKQSESLGDMYEGLLERNAGEKKSGAGQYFTPRPLIETIVKCTKPNASEVIQDPAAGTGGFFICADRYIQAKSNDLKSLTVARRRAYEKGKFVGAELVRETHRLLMMNTMLHGINGKFLFINTMTPEAALLGNADVIYSNPPFGTQSGGGRPTRTDLTHETGNKQLSFLQHIYKSLKSGGRAAVVLPDNVLFETGIGETIREELMNLCNLHTILRLPPKIFYAQGVKTNVLFFNRGRSDKGNTKKVWFYDARTEAPNFGKRTPLTEDYFADFVKCYGRKRDGSSPRKDLGPEGKFRSYTFPTLRAKNFDLNQLWLKPKGYVDPDTLPDPADLVSIILEKLNAASSEIKSLHEHFLARNGGGRKSE